MTTPADSTQKETFPDPIPYCSVGYADSYLATDLAKVTDWTVLTAAQKLAALKMGQKDIDQAFVYHGSKLEYSQDREFPRWTDFRTVGDIDSTIEEGIPHVVAQANAIQAWYRGRQFLNGEQVSARREHQAQGVNSIQRLNSSESSDLNRARQHNLHPEALDLIRSYVNKTGNLEERFFHGSRSHGLRSDMGGSIPPR